MIKKLKRIKLLISSQTFFQVGDFSQGEAPTTFHEQLLHSQDSRAYNNRLQKHYFEGELKGKKQKTKFRKLNPQTRYNIAANTFPDCMPILQRRMKFIVHSSYYMAPENQQEK